MGSIQTLGQITWLAWVGVISIVTSCESKPVLPSVYLLNDGGN